MYNHKIVEEKWRKYWQDNKTFKTDVFDFSKPKFYALDMFPYPSGAGLHVGHPEGYTATDIVSRKKRMEGYNVLFPMGFDSFGLQLIMLLAGLAAFLIMTALSYKTACRNFEMIDL